MELTQEEIELVLNFRKEKELKTPTKTGILKHDLYIVEYKGVNYKLVTENMFQSLFEEFKNSFEVALKKGTKFVCRTRYDFEEWDEVEMEDVEIWDSTPRSKEWAEEHLENIEVL